LRVLFISDVYFPRVNGVSTSIRTFREDLGACGLEVLRNYRAAENPYHRFLVCRKLPPA